MVFLKLGVNLIGLLEELYIDSRMKEPLWLLQGEIWFVAYVWGGKC